MPSCKIKVVPKPEVFVATALHSGSNSQGYDPQLRGFVLQAIDVTYLGESNLTGVNDGVTIHAGEQLTVIGFISRGSYESYDLRQMYYIGGPFKLIIEQVE